MKSKRRITRSSRQELKIRDAFEEYLEEKKCLNKSPATIKGTRFSIEKWMKYLEENDFSDSVKDIDQSYLYSFQNHSLNEDMRPSSLNHYIRDIRAFVYWCVDKEYISKRFKIRLISQQETIKETYTDAEKLKPIAKPSKNASLVEWRSWAIVNWILATGHRAGTVVEIKLGDINYSRDVIMVRKTKTNKAWSSKIGCLIL